VRFGIVKRSGTRHLPEVARRVEEAGFESLMLTEHSHVPVGSMPEEEARRRANLLDPFVALGAAAAVTSRLKLGTAVCVVTHREPLVLAKAVATLDLLSGGIHGCGRRTRRPGLIPACWTSSRTNPPMSRPS